MIEDLASDILSKIPFPFDTEVVQVSCKLSIYDTFKSLDVKGNFQRNVVESKGLLHYKNSFTLFTLILGLNVAGLLQQIYLALVILVENDTPGTFCFIVLLIVMPL